MTFIVKGRNNSFICKKCGKYVKEAKGTVRDHCPFCLYSLHVDISPGDRQCKCNGLMKPIGYKIKKGKISILYKCLKCGYKHYNKAAPDDDIEKLKLLIINCTD